MKHFGAVPMSLVLISSSESSARPRLAVVSTNSALEPFQSISV